MSLNITSDDLWWLFSTIAQTFGAVLAFFGMLTVYRLERLGRMRDECFRRAEDPFKILSPHELVISADDLVDKWSKISDENKREWEHHDSQRVRTAFRQVSMQVGIIKRYLRWHKGILWSFGFFIVYHTPQIILSLFLLPYAHELAGQNTTLPWFSMYLFAVILGLSGLLIFWLIFTLTTDFIIRSIIRKVKTFMHTQFSKSIKEAKE